MLKQYRTFTGLDTLVFIIFPNCKPICLGSLTTISFSSYRHKIPVFTVGKIGTCGFTRGARNVGGTLIFTMINQEWANELKNQVIGLKEYKENIKSDELPPFDLMIVCANEYGASTIGYIYGAEITDEAQVLSVEEFFTENQCKFQAREIDWFEEDKASGKVIQGRRTVSRYSVNMPSDLSESKPYYSRRNILTKETKTENMLEVNKSHEELNIEMKIEDLINGMAWFEFNNVKINSLFKISYVCTYANKIETNSKILEANEDKIKISTSAIKNAFIYNPFYKQTADKVEFIVFPIGKEPVKYIIKVR